MSKSQRDPLESLSDERSGPILGAEEMEIVMDAGDQRPDSGLRGAPEMRWLPLAGVGLAVVLGGALAITGSARQPRLAATVTAAADGLASPRDRDDLAVPSADAEPAAAESAELAELAGHAGGATGTKTQAPTRAPSKAPARAKSNEDAVLAHAGDESHRAEPRGRDRQSSGASAGVVPLRANTPRHDDAAPAAKPAPASEAAPAPAAKAGSPLLDLPPPPEDDDDAPAPDPDASSRPADDEPIAAGDDEPADEDDGLPPPPDPSA